MDSLANNRKAQSMRNLLFGIIYQTVNIVVSFVLKTIAIYELGDAVNGLNGLFTEVIAILSMAELGVGTAIVYNLYKPLAENDTEKLCQLMTLFRKAYTMIAGVIMLLSLVVAPFINLLVTKVDFSDNYIRLIFLLFAARTASSYLFAYKTSLLGADQKNYLPSIINSIIRILTMILGVIVIKITKNFVVYLVLLIVTTVLGNICVSLIANKRYPFLKNSAELPKDEQKKVFANIKHLFVGMISGRITNSTDNILISVMVSTIQTGVYSVYAMLFNAVRNMFMQVQSAVAGSMGNMMVTESNETCAKLFSRLTFLFFIGGSLCAAGLYSVASTFVMKVYTESYVLANSVVFVCAINLFYYVISAPLWQIMQASGLFRWDKNISILGSVINLIVSVGLGLVLEKVLKIQSGGMLGIFIGTTCTRVIQSVMKIQLLYTKRFNLKKQMRDFYAMWVLMTVLACGEMLLAHFIVNKITLFSGLSRVGPYIDIVIRGFVAVVIALAINIAIFCKRDEFKYAWGLICALKTKLVNKKRGVEA